MIHRNVKTILENAALDPEQMVAPKDIWFDQEMLEAWYAERRKVETAGD